MPLYTMLVTESFTHSHKLAVSTHTTGSSFSMRQLVVCLALLAGIMTVCSMPDTASVAQDWLRRWRAIGSRVEMGRIELHPFQLLLDFSFNHAPDLSELLRRYFLRVGYLPVLPPAHQLPIVPGAGPPAGRRDRSLWGTVMNYRSEGQCLLTRLPHACVFVSPQISSVCRTNGASFTRNQLFRNTLSQLIGVIAAERRN